MDLSTAPDAVLEALARAALLRNPLGQIFAALALSCNAESHLAEAVQWSRVDVPWRGIIRRSTRDLPRTG